MDSIYKTVEFDAWSKKLDYEEYCEHHQKCAEEGYIGPKVGPIVYDGLAMCFEAQFKYDMAQRGLH